MSSEHSPTRIGVAIVEQDGKFLVGVRQPTQTLAGKAEFPGGKCLPEESAAACAVRETAEETGLDVIAEELLYQIEHRYSHDVVALQFWLCRLVDVEQSEPAEHFLLATTPLLEQLDFPKRTVRHRFAAEAGVGLMRALVLNEGQLRYRSDYESKPPETPATNLVPVNVLMAGICETDLQLVAGYMNFAGVPGHEFCGIATSGKYAGQRVVGEINCSCGNCSYCALSLGRHCPHRTVIGILNHDGAFADQLYVPEENLYPVPDEVSTEEAVFVEPLAAAYEIVSQVKFKAEDRIAILGDGRLGNLCAQVLHQEPGEVIVLGRHPHKLDRLHKLGISTELSENIAQERQFEYVVDCTGSASGIEAALGYVRPRGTIILKTTVAGTQSLSLAPFVIDELTLIGSRCGLFAPAIAALQHGQIDVKSLIDSRYPLESGLEAFERAQTPGVMKVLLEISAG
ncbi:MAG: alcohol dehydrogenase catalytic domain-containing protein [Planctomycetaceae bacterium]